MDILGSIGKLYTFVLLVILFLGSGLAVWAGINAIINKKDSIKESSDKITENLSTKLQNIKNNNIIGGINMKNNSFIKLAVFSFIGIIISAAILTVLPNYSNPRNNMNMNSQYNTSAMNMQNGMNAQSNMQGMTSNSTDLYSIQQQLNNMQQQIYSLQNQLNNSSMNSSSNMNNSNMNNGSMNSSNSSNSSMNNSNSGSSNSSMSSMPMM